MKPGRSSTATGKQAEGLALAYLTRQGGLRLIERNYQCRPGEIDLIMMDHEVLVFVEVRYRQDQRNRFGSAAESVTVAKQKRLIGGAQHFLNSQQGYAEYPCRFDVLAMSGPIDHPDYQWIQDAFRVPG